MKRAPVLAWRILFELVFASVTLYAVRPAFATRHLPLQDLPQHLAAISVLGRYAFDPVLRQYFELTLSRTQYLLPYLIATLLSFPLGVTLAARILLAGSLASTSYALRFLARQTGGDERWAVLAWPFLWNPQTMFGFLNFTLGLPLALLTLGLFANREKRTDRKRRIVLALLALAVFYSHIVPYGLMGVGLLLSLETDRAEDLRSLAGVKARLRRWSRELSFLAPSLLAALVWVVRSPARDASIRAGGVSKEILLTWPDRMALPALFRGTILDTWGNADDKALLGWGFCLLAILAMSRDVSSGTAARSSESRIAWLPLVCALLYVFLPDTYGWIWPIHTRFAVLAVVLLPIAFRRAPSSLLGGLVVTCMACCTVWLTRDLMVSFERWDNDELGDIDGALLTTRPDKRLIALVTSTRSPWIPSAMPMVHVAAYYQVEGGAVATFSFADLPQSPFRYRDDGPRPPRLHKGWEWEPSLAEADPSHTYYDYVLVRRSVRSQSLESLSLSAADEAARLPDLYERVYAGAEWYLYERRVAR